MLVQVTTPHYCAGFVVEGGVVVRSAPILAWTRGKSLRQVLFVLRKRGAHMLEVSDRAPREL